MHFIISSPAWGDDYSQRQSCILGTYAKSTEQLFLNKNYTYLPIEIIAYVSTYNKQAIKINQKVGISICDFPRFYNFLHIAWQVFWTFYVSLEVTFYSPFLASQFTLPQSFINWSFPWMFIFTFCHQLHQFFHYLFLNKLKRNHTTSMFITKHLSPPYCFPSRAVRTKRSDWSILL